MPQRVATQTSSDTTASRSPRRATYMLLVAAMLAAAYLSFFAYKAGGMGDRTTLDLRLAGNDAAPAQYRIGVYALAHTMVMHLHIMPDMAFALLDLGSGIATALLLFHVLERSIPYARAGRTLQWFAAAVFVLLVLWYMAWLLWLIKPETLPAAACVAAMLWLWDPCEPSFLPPTARAVVLLAITAVLASFRADIACLLNAGVLVFTLASRDALSLPRRAAALTAAAGALLAAIWQLWLMRVMYPRATYGRVKLWQLEPNLVHASRWPPFVIFLLPLGWVVFVGLRRGLPRDAAGKALLCGAGFYGALWIMIGKIDEVRIFLPFALALAPVTVEAAMEHLATGRDKEEAYS